MTGNSSISHNSFGLSQQQFTATRVSLRRTTHSLHQKLERLWTPDERFASEGTYRAFLHTLLKAHCEVGVRAAAGRGDKVELALEESRIAALGTDLDVCPPTASTTPFDSVDYSWGVGYVLNGSTLGASIILKRAYLKSGWPNGYMRLGQGYVHSGDAKSFFAKFDALALDVSEVERGAIETFSLFDTSASSVGIK